MISITTQLRGPTPEIERGQEVRIIATPHISDVIMFRTPPVLDLPQIQEILDVGRFGITELEACLLFFENPEGNLRRGYEAQILSLWGTISNRPYPEIPEAIEELRHMGRIYLAAPRNGHVSRFHVDRTSLPLESGISPLDRDFVVRRFGYSHTPIIATSTGLYSVVEDTVTGMDCKVLSER